jgi:hypothetical protein
MSSRPENEQTEAAMCEWIGVYVPCPVTSPASAEPAVSLITRGRRRQAGTGYRSLRSATLRPVEDYTNKYKGEQVEVELFGGEYQDGTLTAYCGIEGVPHIELNGHILIPLQNIASLHCSSRCDAPEPDWPPRGLTGADGEET